MEIERKKRIFLLRVLVAGAVVLIAAAWIFNLKSELRVAEKTINKDASEEAVDLRMDIDETIKSIEDKIGELKKTTIATITTDAISTTTQTVSASTTVISSSTDFVATSTEEKNSSCPEYINCMPSIGETRSCLIPKGCEGKTIIAY